MLLRSRRRCDGNIDLGLHSCDEEKRRAITITCGRTAYIRDLRKLEHRMESVMIYTTTLSSTQQYGYIRDMVVRQIIPYLQYNASDSDMISEACEYDRLSELDARQ